MAKKEILGVALSGGGIKSFSQYAFLEWCLQEDIRIDVVAGTSMGSILASLYAIGLNAYQIKQELIELEDYVKKNRLIRPSVKAFPLFGNRIYGGLTDGEPFEVMLTRIFKKYGVVYIDDVKYPLAINAVDLKSGKMVVFTSDPTRFDFSDHPDWIIENHVPLAVAVRASCSFPLVFAFCQYKDYQLVDGGVRMNTPVPVIQAFHATRIIAITASEANDAFDGTSISSIANRVLQLMGNENEKAMVKDAHLVLNFPIDPEFIFKVGKGQEVIDYSQKLFETMENDVKQVLTPKQLDSIPWLSLFKRRK